MTETEALIARVLAHDEKATKGPWKGDGHAYNIYGSHGRGIDTVELPDGFTGVRIIDIRGWGSLSKLGDKEAERIQHANSDLVTTYRTDAPKLARMLRVAIACIRCLATVRGNHTEEERDEALAVIEKIARES